MANGNIPLRWLDEPWTEERAGQIISHEIGVTFPPEIRPMEWISKLVQMIPNMRHRQFFMMRYGILDEKFHTYDDLAKEHGVSRTRAHQIDTEVFERLRQKILELETEEV